MGFTKKQIESLVQEPIKSYKVGRGCDVGDNLCSALYKLIVNTESGKTITVVYKTLPEDPERKSDAIRDETFRRENYFYTIFAPNVESAVKSYLDSIQLLSSNVSEIMAHVQFPIPKYFAGLNDNEKDFICIEDLRTLGYKMKDKFIGMTFPECCIALKKLAKFHALSYFYLRYESEDIFQRIDTYKVYLRKHWAVSDSRSLSYAFQKVVSKVYNNAVEYIRTHSDAEDKEELVIKMSGENDCLLHSVYSKVASTTLGTDSKYFPLLIHGDLWINNLLFSYNDNGEPIDAKFVDFQYSRRGNIYEDLNLFLCTSTTVEFRKQFLQQALNVYYDEFISTLSLINFPPPSNFSREKFIDAYYENVLPAYFILSMYIPIHLGKPSENGSKGTDFTDDLIKRMERSPQAFRRLEEVTREAVEMGII